MIKIFNSIEVLNQLLGKYKSNKSIGDYRIILGANNYIYVYIKGNEAQEVISKLKTFSNLRYKFIAHHEYDDYDIYFKEKHSIDVHSSRLRLDNLINTNSKSEKFSVPVVTFYSYKGGVGRSTMLATYASTLAIKKKWKVAILDCDFEAPGLNNFYLEDPSILYNKNGLVEYFLDSEISENLSISNYCREVSKKFSGDGAIYVFSAGNLNTQDNIGKIFETDLDHYLNGLTRLDFFNKETIVQRFSELINSICTELSPDIILIDSRTGFNDIFGIAALRLSNIVVGLFGGNAQSQPGMEFFLNLLKRPEHPILLVVNSIIPNTGKIKAFKLFQERLNCYLEKISRSHDTELLGSITVDAFPNGHNEILENIGMPTDSYEDYIHMIQSGAFYDYNNIFDKITEYSLEVKSNTKPKHQEANERDIITLKKQLLSNIATNLPSLYAESIPDFEKEITNNRYFFRKSMEDLFNADKFLVIGNKGTGKTYIYRSLGHDKVVKALQERANKTEFEYKFIQVFNETYCFDTIKLDGQYKPENADLFFERFWKIYIWCAIMSNKPYGYQSTINIHSIKDDTETAEYFKKKINDSSFIMQIEQDLLSLDKFLKEQQNRRLTFIFDGLDQIVKPVKWSERIAPLINLCKKMSYTCISPKLFIRSDLYNKIGNINNKNDLNNRIIYIEWTREEIFAYFFKFVLSHSKAEFFKLIKAYNQYPIESIQSTINAIEASGDQPPLEEFILRQLCASFFGKYADTNSSHKFGESYDWFYNNLMNANETISLRPFIDLISISVRSAIKDDSSPQPILPSLYYTNGRNRAEAVEKHFMDLAKEQGNQDLEIVFDYIKNKAPIKFKRVQLSKREFIDLLDLIIKNGDLKECTDRDSIIELLIVNGVIKDHFIRLYDGPHINYKFALLYKYYLGLKSNRKR